jgi:hypothetical protein
VAFNFIEELHKSLEDGCESVCDIPRSVCVFAHARACVREGEREISHETCSELNESTCNQLYLNKHIFMGGFTLCLMSVTF